MDLWWETYSPICSLFPINLTFPLFPLLLWQMFKWVLHLPVQTFTANSAVLSLISFKLQNLRKKKKLNIFRPQKTAILWTLPSALLQVKSQSLSIRIVFTLYHLLFYPYHRPHSAFIDCNILPWVAFKSLLGEMIVLIKSYQRNIFILK